MAKGQMKSQDKFGENQKNFYPITKFDSIESPDGANTNLIEWLRPEALKTTFFYPDDGNPVSMQAATLMTIGSLLEPKTKLSGNKHFLSYLFSSIMTNAFGVPYYNKQAKVPNVFDGITEPEDNYGPQAPYTAYGFFRPDFSEGRSDRQTHMGLAWGTPIEFSLGEAGHRVIWDQTFYAYIYNLSTRTQPVYPELEIYYWNLLDNTHFCLTITLEEWTGDDAYFGISREGPQAKLRDLSWLEWVAYITNNVDM